MRLFCGVGHTIKHINKCEVFKMLIVPWREPIFHEYLWKKKIIIIFKENNLSGIDFLVADFAGMTIFNLFPFEFVFVPSA